jgi:hypothetical protein
MKRAKPTYLHLFSYRLMVCNDKVERHFKRSTFVSSVVSFYCNRKGGFCFRNLGFWLLKVLMWKLLSYELWPHAVWQEATSLWKSLLNSVWSTDLLASIFRHNAITVNFQPFIYNKWSRRLSETLVSTFTVIMLIFMFTNFHIFVSFSSAPERCNRDRRTDTLN